MHTAEFLATVPLFSSLDSVELSRFAELLREKSFLKGSVILFAALIDVARRRILLQSA